jgi:hypothetical protein
MVVEQYPTSSSFLCGALFFDLVEQYPLELVEILLDCAKFQVRPFELDSLTSYFFQFPKFTVN